MIEILRESLSAELGSLVALLPRVGAALLLLLLFTLVGRMLGALVVRLMERGKLPQTHRKFFRGLVAWAVALFGLVLGLNVLGLEAVAAGLMAGGGVSAVVLGFAFRGIGENLLAGLFLAFSRPFKMGDLIQSGEFQGQVRSIEMRYTHIRTGDGRDVYIPSGQIFNDVLVNYTRDGLRRLSFKIGVDYGDDSRRGREVLLEALRGTPGLLDDPPPTASVAALQSQYQELEAAFWVDTFQQGVNIVTARSEAVERCRLALREAGFTFSSEVTTGVVLEQKPAAPG